MNFLDVAVHEEAGAVTVAADGLRLTPGGADARALAAWNGRRAIMGVRPEHLVPGDGAPGLSFDARVEVVEQLGSEILLETRVGSQNVTVARIAAESPVARGDRVRLSAQPGRLHFFDPETELPLRD
jgi:multiple sugar transport system ATP-binding protein